MLLCLRQLFALSKKSPHYFGGTDFLRHTIDCFHRETRYQSIVDPELLLTDICEKHDAPPSNTYLLVKDLAEKNNFPKAQRSYLKLQLDGTSDHKKLPGNEMRPFIEEKIAIGWQWAEVYHVIGLMRGRYGYDPDYDEAKKSIVAMQLANDESNKDKREALVHGAPTRSFLLWLAHEQSWPEARVEVIRTTGNTIG
jgi:hypothetical protein